MSQIERKNCWSPLSDGVERWSGYWTQTKAWQIGYEWASERGPFAGRDIDEAIEGSGYDLDSPEAEQLVMGAGFVQNERWSQ